ncbi:penicillin-binding protein 1A [Limnothrix sp. FACHB-881]|nr:MULTISPECIES: penicillin-binding protein 1A [unclassified Limnothrix]MBD2159916.1 penicillin-binding protein 1A [Limnothrix sp. FACHB-1083]MBD2190616.1 penicillin-binding protein 1A [Limnothrix sp. FACHB-1088]MBD2553546.1 penicillin-binding protein 1A [Limnothrix sp. FACHB-708]MBD2590585.1 penicillin-binding protein 1A [Limnothrix sp. FACHB-406]MBD2635391.1 penicillin-binding protein 1A [Limnothrix sp. FACHB-881]
MLGSAAVAGALVGLAVSFRNLPDVRILQTYTPSETSYIYDIKGRVLASLHDEANRVVVPLNQISPHLKRAVIAIEDSSFYQHPGINPGSIMRALVTNLERGRTSEGGSTLTMQLVKNLFLSPQRRISRKVAEAVLSLRLEQILKKDEILELYLNQVYWGHNNYGIETASRSYFGKAAADLNLAESAMLAGLIQAPEDYSPFLNFERAKQRQAIVLGRMLDLGWITPAEELAARNQPLNLGKSTSFQSSKLPYVTEAVTQELKKRFRREDLFKGGMRIQTTVDFDFQTMAEATVSAAHARMRSRGLRADQVALVAVDPRTHFVKAMVGGVDYRKSQFNRAIQAMRQPGSAFKPFVYYAAFATGRYTPNSAVNDTPVSYNDGGVMYRPKNYGGGFSGSVSIRRALEISLNIPVVRLGQEVGLNKVIETCRLLGFQSPLEPVLSLPLGSEDVTPLEMAGAYATFANNGWHSDTTFIVQVTDSSGKVLLDNTPRPQLVLDPWATATLTDTLRGVITNGTAKTANIGRPAAGKTGTTDSERDIWFVGYVPQLSVAVWAGNDNYRPIGYGATGGSYVAPIWREFMLKALQGVPAEDFRKPWEFQKP